MWNVAVVLFCCVVSVVSHFVPFWSYEKKVKKRKRNYILYSKPTSTLYNSFQLEEDRSYQNVVVEKNTSCVEQAWSIHMGHA